MYCRRVSGGCAIWGRRDLGELLLCSREGAFVTVFSFFSFLYFSCFDGTLVSKGIREVVDITVILLRLGYE